MESPKLVIKSDHFAGGKNLNAGARAGRTQAILQEILSEVISDIKIVEDAIVPISGVVTPAGVVTGYLGQLYYDTVGTNWYICTSAPSGTNWYGLTETFVNYITLADDTPASEGALLVGTSAKASLGASLTVEDCLADLDTKNPPARLTGAVDPNAGGGTAGAEGDIYVDTVTEISYVNTDGTNTGWSALVDYVTLADDTIASEGAALVGTSAKASLGASVTVEDCLADLDTKNPPARLTGVVDPNAGAGTAGDPGDLYTDTVANVVYVNTDGTNFGWSILEGVEDPGVVATFIVRQMGQPLAGETISIGADVYEADGAGGNINFAIAGGANATMANLLAAMIANGTENLFFDALSPTHIRARSADAPQGTIVAANPDMLVQNTLTNYAASLMGNLNTQGGRAPGPFVESTAGITVTAEHAVMGNIYIAFPFNVIDFSVQCRTAANVVFSPAADTFGVVNFSTVLVTLAGGGGNLGPGDRVTIIARG